MARRMQPTAPSTGSPAELLQRGVCGTRYMERFGGYGRHWDLGLILFQVMTVMDFLQPTMCEQPRMQWLCWQPVLGQGVHSAGRSALGDGGFRFHQGIGCCDQRQELAGGVSSGQKAQSLSHPLPKQRASQSESKRAKEKAMQEGASNSRGGGGLRACGETNPCPGSMTDSINFSTWCLSLPTRWILRSRTDFAWHLRRSFSSMPQSNPVLCTTASLASCWGSFSGLSKRGLSKLCRARLLHVLVLTLNYMHLGRFPDLRWGGDLRPPSQRSTIDWGLW